MDVDDIRLQRLYGLIGPAKAFHGVVANIVNKHVALQQEPTHGLLTERRFHIPVHGSFSAVQRKVAWSHKVFGDLGLSDAPKTVARCWLNFHDFRAEITKSLGAIGTKYD